MANGFWKRFIQVAQIVGPAALTVAGVPPAIIPLVVHGITLAEAAAQDKPMNGADKKAMAMDAVRTSLSAVNTVRPTFNVEEISSVVSQGIDTTVAAINAAKDIPLPTQKDVPPLPHSDPSGKPPAATPSTPLKTPPPASMPPLKTQSKIEPSTDVKTQVTTETKAGGTGGAPPSVK